LSFSLPYSSKRRYLTGTDWIIGALLDAATQRGIVGLGSQAIIEVDGPLSDIMIRQTLQQISRRFPLLHGRVARDWMNLAPYWRSFRSYDGHVPPIPVRMIDLPAGADAEADRLFADHANTPLAGEEQHLRFLLVRIGRRKSRLGAVFDHRLLDGFGAECFFRLMDMTWQDRLEEIAPRIAVTEPAHLDHWGRRFSNGRKLNNRLMNLNDRELCALAAPSAGLRRRISFQLDQLTAAESARFSQLAGEEIQMPIVLPSAASRAVLAMHRAIPQTPLAGTRYLVSTSVNTRPPDQGWEKMLFNQFSFMMLHTENHAAGSPGQIALEMRDQFIEQVMENVPFKIFDSSALLRICPVSILSQLTSLMFGGRLCSIYFAFLRETGYPEQTFMGLPATNLIHTPMAFCPPSMTLSVTHFAGRANLSLTYVDGSMSDETAKELLAEFKSLLLSTPAAEPASR
jgi:hypothetical protein